MILQFYAKIINLVIYHFNLVSMHKNFSVQHEGNKSALSERSLTKSTSLVCKNGFLSMFIKIFSSANKFGLKFEIEKCESDIENFGKKSTF